MRNRYWLLFFPLVPLLLSAGCRENTLESYYYPLDELREGLVYEYRGAGNTQDPPFYWYYRTIEQEGATYLVGMYYDLNFTPYQFMREEKVSNGMLLVDTYFYGNDSTGRQVQSPVEIEAGNAFSFEPPDPKQILFYKIRFPVPDNPGTTCTLTRNRQYMSDTTYIYGGKTYDAAVFYVRELIDIEDAGHVEQEFGGTEIYAKGLGLVYFRKNVSEGFALEYKLTDRYTREAFEEKYRMVIGDW